jgi:ribosomal protein S18 acetylase RimI-like enzyme
VGSGVVSLPSDHLIDEHGASAVSLTTAIDNHAAQRCYEKAGFGTIKEVLDTDWGASL